MLSWDYENVKLHLGRELENRLKFASTLSVTFLDKELQRGGFYSLKTGAERFATLHKCSCRDSAERRKSPMPCMHMFRLAMELGHMPWFKRSRLVGAIGGGAFVAKYLGEIKLREIPPDQSSWGNWSPDIHRSRVQQTRQLRGYDYWVPGRCFGRVTPISPSLWMVASSFDVNKLYRVSLTFCTCPDFEKAKLPCKHIYAVAIGMGCRLPISREFHAEHQHLDLW